MLFDLHPTFTPHSPPTYHPGNATIVKHFLDFGAKLSVSDVNGATPFLYAALNNNPVRGSNGDIFDHLFCLL